jgi:hypothetical protein
MIFSVKKFDKDKSATQGPKPINRRELERQANKPLMILLLRDPVSIRTHARQ